MKIIKRNDPCHCGSGKKYKKCCINKDKEKKREERQKAQKEMGEKNTLKEKKEKKEKKENETRGLEREIVVVSKEELLSNPSILKSFLVSNLSSFSQERKMFEEYMKKGEKDEDSISDLIFALHSSATKEEEYRYLLDAICALLRNYSSIYLECNGDYIYYATCAAVGCNDLESIPPLINVVDTIEFWPSYYSLFSLLLYIGHQPSLEAISSLVIKSLSQDQRGGNIEIIWKRRENNVPIMIILLIAVTALLRDEELESSLLVLEPLLQKGEPWDKEEAEEAETKLLHSLKKGLHKKTASHIIGSNERGSLSSFLSLAPSFSQKGKIPFSRAFLGLFFLCAYLEEERKDTSSQDHLLLSNKGSLAKYLDSIHYNFEPRLYERLAFMEVLYIYSDLLLEEGIIDTLTYQKVFQCAQEIALDLAYIILSESEWHSPIILFEIEKLGHIYRISDEIAKLFLF